MPSNTNSHTQRSRILALLIAAHGEPVFLPQILELRISQYSARIHELRELGFRIVNERERRNGKLFTSFRLVPNETAELPAPKSESDTPLLFENVLQAWRDDG
jgi:Helix-turn-helix domain